MKFFLVLSFFLVNTVSFGQVDTLQLKENLRRLDASLISKDSIEIGKLLDEKVTFGHSNGWIESKADVLKDISGGYLVYDKIESADLRIISDKGWASVRMNANVKGTVNSKGFDMKLHILQVWRRVKGEWKLIARQSTKI